MYFLPWFVSTGLYNSSSVWNLDTILLLCKKGISTTPDIHTFSRYWASQFLTGLGFRTHALWHWTELALSPIWPPCLFRVSQLLTLISTRLNALPLYTPTMLPIISGTTIMSRRWVLTTWNQASKHAEMCHWYERAGYCYIPAPSMGISGQVQTCDFIVLPHSEIKLPTPWTNETMPIL